MLRHGVLPTFMWKLRMLVALKSPHRLIGMFDAEDVPNNGIDEDCDGQDALSSTHDLDGQVIEIYPNPVSDVLKVKTNSIQNTRLQFITLNGQLLLNHKGVNTLDCSQILEGIYLLKVIDEVSGKFIVERVVVLN